MTQIENGDAAAAALIAAIYPHTGKAHVIGVTGAAGTGKSSLIDRLTAEYRRQHKTVGVIVVDPSSLFSGGALLGDRVRLRDHFLDPGVFIRSFATRGGTGGLAPWARSAVRLLDGAGMDIIIVETIGVGQDELQIAAVAQTLVLVCMPGMGDEIQHIKAGIAEVADILAINKADLPGAEATIEMFKAIFDAIPVVATSALNNVGVSALVQQIDTHRARSRANGSFQKRQVQLCRQELLAALRERILTQLVDKFGDAALEQQAERVAERQIDPDRAAEELAQRAGF